MNYLESRLSQEKGFTLIEMMVTMLIAMVVLGGLMLNFTQQNSEYKYQGKRIDAVQDLEFAIKFVAEDVRSALMSGTTTVIITPTPPSLLVTTNVDFYVWDETFSVTADKRAHRQYTYSAANKSLSYDRELTTASPGEVLPHVTFFKVFDDAVDARTGFTGIPSAQPSINLLDPAVTGVSGYTILIEVEVDAGYKNGSFVDVRGNNVGITGHKRIWRYIQVYPRTSVE